MRLAQFRSTDGRIRLGALTASGGIADLAAVAVEIKEPAHFFESMMTLISGGDEALQAARRCLDRASAGDCDGHVSQHPYSNLVCPLPNPPALRLCTAYPGHYVRARRAAALLAERELGAPKPAEFPDKPPPLFFQHPFFYRGNHKALGGPGDVIAWPDFARYLDFECEIAAIIGLSGADFTDNDAENAIFGYTILNDVSARIPQLQEMPFGVGPCKGKGFDGGMKIGPVIVTADEFSPSCGAVEIRVNGERWSETTIAGAAFDWPSIVRFASAGETLCPGEIISSGCIENGSGIELDRWLSRGDRLEIEVDGIGVLSNSIIE